MCICTCKLFVFVRVTKLTSLLTVRSTTTIVSEIATTTGKRCREICATQRRPPAAERAGTTERDGGGTTTTTTNSPPPERGHGGRDRRGDVASIRSGEEWSRRNGSSTAAGGRGVSTPLAAGWFRRESEARRRSRGRTRWKTSRSASNLVAGSTRSAVAIFRENAKTSTRWEAAWYRPRSTDCT